MLIPSKIADNIRRFEHGLLNTDHKNRHKGFFLAVRPIIKWAKPHLINAGLTPDEAEAELYLLSVDLLNGYDPERSSLVPYIQKQVLWYIEKLAKRIKRYMSFDYEELKDYDNIYELEDEIYLGTPGILFEERFIGKVLSKADKFIISQILELDSNDLSQNKLATILGLDRRTTRERLFEIAEKLNGGFYG